MKYMYRCVVCHKIMDREYDPPPPEEVIEDRHHYRRVWSMNTNLGWRPAKHTSSEEFLFKRLK